MASQNIVPFYPPNQVDAAALLPLGTVTEDEFGSEFIYLQGIGSTVVGSCVTYNAAGVTALLVANAIGPCAFAMAAILANQFGWYCIKNLVGTCPARAAAATAANARLFATATPGEIDDAVVAGDMIANCFSITAPGAQGALVVRCAYPFVSDNLG